MPELATAWVTLTITARDARKSIDRELNGVDSAGAGRRAGQQFSSGAAAATNLSGVEQKLVSAGQRAGQAAGKTLAAGITAGAAAGVAALGTSIKLGVDRLLAIDDAKGKLKGLGHDTQSTAKIMDSALASVKGTAFGLGDAATISASAVAAGIKPGEQLTKYLKLTADAASIAGSSLGDMGHIFNQVQTGGRAMSDDLNQLGDRGIPILQWVGKEMGVTAGQVKEMASKGKVSSEIFFQAIQKNIGGAALQSGNTVRGSFNNAKAAMGRFGAALAGPEFNRAPSTFNRITKALDDATPAAAKFAEKLDAKVFNQWVPEAQKAWAALKVNPAVREDWTRIESMFLSLKSTAVTVGPAVLQIGSSLGQASAALGISTWKLFLTTLEAAAGVVNTLAGPLQTVAELMRDHQGIVTAALGAWLLFRTVPSVLGNLRTGMASVSTEGAKTSGVVQGLGASFARLQGGADRVREVGSAFAAYGGSVREMYRQVQQIEPSLSRTQAGVATFGAVAGNAARSGLGALKSAASGVIGALGGPWGAAFAVAGIAATAIISQNQRSAQSMEAVRRAAADAAEAQASLNAALFKSRGAYDEAVASSAAERIGELKNQLEAAASREGSPLDNLRAEGEGLFSWKSMIGGDENGRTQAQAIKAGADEAKAAQQALRGLGLTQQELAAKTYGSAGAFEAMVSRLDSTTAGGKKAAAMLRDARAEYLQTQDAARRSTPGIAEMAKAMEVLGDKSSTAANRTSALKAAIDALNPARSNGAAIAEHDRVLRQIAESSQEALDKTKGFGQELLSAEFGISTATANGEALRQKLLDLADASVSAAAAGRPLAEIHDANAAKLKGLAAQSGITVDEITAAFNKLGGRDIELTARLAGAPETVQQIGQISRAMQDAKFGEKKVIPISVDDKAIAALKTIDVEVTRLPNNKGIEVVAKTETARAQLANVMTALTALPPGKAIDMSTSGGQAVLDLLKAANVEVTSHNGKDIEVAAPNAPAVKALLEGLNLTVRSDNGKNILVSSSGGPETLTMLNGLKATIQQIPDEKRVKVTVTADPNFRPDINQIPMFPGGSSAVGATGNANGSIRSYANGGLDGPLPRQALMQRGRGRGLVQWAEGETGVESFIPWAPGKRQRSTMILSETARAFGYQLVRPGDFFQKFANGGISVDDVKSFASGVTSGKYTFGGFDGWMTDCSGAQARVANFITGGSGRFATANEAEALASRGFTTGRPPEGQAAYLIGWYNGGPGGGHTSGVIIDSDGAKTIVEMGGANGNGSFGSGTDPETMANTAWIPLRGSGSSKYGDTNQYGDSSTGGTSSGGGGAKSYGGGGFGRLGTAIAEALFGPRGSSGGSSGGGSGGGSASSSGSGARSALSGGGKVDAKKVREAQDKADDAAKKVAVEEQKLREAEAAKKPKASTIQAAKDRVEKAKRDAAQAKDDLETAKRGAPAKSTTAGGASSKQLTAAQNKADDAEKAAALAKTQLAEIEKNPKATKSAKEAAKNRADKTRRDADQAKADLEALKSKGGSKDGKTTDQSDTSEFKSLSQNLVSGAFQAIGLDGSLFSNPFEWPNVKSATSLMNYIGGVAKSLSGSDSEDMGGLVGGAGAGVGLNVPNLADFMKPIQPQTPVTPAGPGMALPIPQRQGDTYNISGLNPRDVVQKIDSRQNAAYRRQSGALV